MDRFQIILTEHAITDLKEISKELREQIHLDLRILEAAPFPSGTTIKRLKGFRPSVCRLRTDDFRVLYHIQGDILTVLRIIDRKLLERIIKRLRR